MSNPLQKVTHRAVKTTVVTFVSLLMMGMVGCGNKETATENTANPASVAEAQAVPMSAAPADDKGTPVLVNETNATVDAGPDASLPASTAVAMDMPPASGAEVMEGGADNSAMDKISEHDQVIDNEPASPNAPKAPEAGEATQGVGNGKVGQKAQ
ncbi:MULTISPECIES: hypothetical protein [unclassified Moraxella]|uniref:hypothetical protein n=1 Tax=unclassified Moraxella TaxID=2685852 RepID=UPI003AF457B1